MSLFNDKPVVARWCCLYGCNLAAFTAWHQFTWSALILSQKCSHGLPMSHQRTACCHIVMDAHLAILLSDWLTFLCIYMLTDTLVSNAPDTFKGEFQTISTNENLPSHCTMSKGYFMSGLTRCHFLEGHLYIYLAIHAVTQHYVHTSANYNEITRH